ncbi:citrate synthase, putative [Eimeria acervulina]|uniref:Citrate synthase n=1 Tax=Eimeria acervulina TaxID=5801 RepID=U6GKD1_EIMAC|nr:citrate synthase, putative [Eimeria acervulina]CDI79049.1 citrate synthase, putative [Eimeria acervulina]
MGRPRVCCILRIAAGRGPALLPTAAAATAGTPATAAAAAKTHRFWVSPVAHSTAATARAAAATAAAAAAAELPFAAVLAARRSYSSSSRSSSSGGSLPQASSAAVSAAVEALQQQLSAAAAEKQQRMQRLRKEFGSVQIGEVTPLNVMGGMRGLTALLTETSRVDPEQGLRLHGVPMRQLLLQQLPKMNSAHLYPSVEALLWYLLTSKVPTASEVSLMQRCLYEMMISAASEGSAAAGAGAGAAAAAEGFTQERFIRVPAALPALLQVLPADGHPMAAFAAAAAALSDYSFFRVATEEGVISKKDIWRPALVDALALVARAAVAAAHIYRNKFGEGEMPAPDPDLDFATNFSRLLGFKGQQQEELLRLYLLLHADHEGGNVSAHAAHLVGSSLADPFAAFAAGMAGLGGPLHGLANQKCLAWLRSAQQQLRGSPPTKDNIRDIALATLKAGGVIPGFGHAVLRVTDPRFTMQREFALRHIPEDPLFQLLEVVREVVPQILAGKVSSPYPNVDCHSGVLLQALGLQQEKFYTVLFGVSRSLGIASQFVWARALGLPIERPKSVTLSCLEELSSKSSN